VVADEADGRAPVGDADVAAAALDALAALARRQPTTGGGRAARPTRTESAAAGSLSSTARSAGFAARRWLLARGDRGGVAGFVVARGYRLREWRQERALRAARRRQSDDAER
jgi:hypothetical protein